MCSYIGSVKMDESDYLEDNNLFERHRIVADPKQGPIRIDKFLTTRMPNVTRTWLQRAIQEKFVKVNDKDTKPNYRIRPNDVVTLYFYEPPRDKEVLPENIPLAIIYEDDFLMVVDKPAGMVVHPAHQNWNGTLVNALVYHFKNLPQLPGNTGRPGLVHRIDKDTSGLVVIAKTEQAMTGLAKQFFDHSIERKYWALVWGEPLLSQGTICVNLGRSLKDRRITTAFPSGNGGRTATTHYSVLKKLRYVSLVECQLETGRTHQIRAHMKYLGHTLFQDSMYGGNKILRGTSFSKYRQFVQNCFTLLPRQALHAKTLGFVHPITKKNVSFESDLPNDLKTTIAKWEHYIHYN